MKLREAGIRTVLDYLVQDVSGFEQYVVDEDMVKRLRAFRTEFWKTDEFVTQTKIMYEQMVRKMSDRSYQVLLHGNSDIRKAMRQIVVYGRLTDNVDVPQKMVIDRLMYDTHLTDGNHVMVSKALFDKWARHPIMIFHEEDETIITLKDKRVHFVHAFNVTP